jgi:hypothetical protein
MKILATACLRVLLCICLVFLCYSCVANYSPGAPAPLPRVKKEKPLESKDLVGTWSYVYGGVEGVLDFTEDAIIGDVWNGEIWQGSWRLWEGEVTMTEWTAGRPGVFTWKMKPRRVGDGIVGSPYGFRKRKQIGMFQIHAR